ncbi:MBL fold metallo-hydrolase [Marinihelvus fidelis]|nr:MBL fold metallo-hydrolase [Marinihelvus fidelis]
MKRIHRTALSLAAAAAMPMAGTVLAEETLPLKSVNKAGEIIDAAIAAYGGEETIENLKTVARQSTFTTWATNQSRKPGPPWDEGAQSTLQAIDLENGVYASRQAGDAGGFEFDTTVVIDGEEGWNVDYRAGTVTDNPNADFNTASGPFVRVTAPLLVRQLMERRQTSHWLGEADVDGRPHDIITLVMEVGPGLALYFDRETHLLSRSERVLPPFGQVDYRFLDYTTIDGIPFASTFKLLVNDQPNITIDYSSTQVNQPIAQFAALPDDFERVEGAAQPTEMVLEEFEEGVFLAGANGTYAMFVEMDDHVVAVGATAGIADRIEALREAGVDKPIRHAVLTHHHNDHLVGVKDYEAEGATLYTVAENESVVRDNAEDGDTLDLVFVEDRLVFESGDRRVEIIDLGPTPHVEHLLVAWLPEEGVMFEADHFPNPPNGRMVPANSNTRALAAAIEREQLDVRYIVGAHSPRVAPIADLHTALGLTSRVKTAGL